MKTAVTAYSLEAGLADITAYYNAGTIIGALQSMQNRLVRNKQQPKRGNRHRNRSKGATTR
jgi:hypothetical protein